MKLLPQKSKPIKNFQSGQALVLVLLSLAVVLTIVLFVLARSITDIAVSSGQEESVRAFSAAEAGIERALVIGTSIGSTTIGDANYSANVTSYAEGGSDFVYPIPLSSGDSANLWFVAHDTGGNITCGGGNPCYTGNSLKVCWGKPGTDSNIATTPAIELSIYYLSTPGDYSTAKIARGVFDPNASRIATNAFTISDPGTCQINGVNYAFQKTILMSDLLVPASSYQNEDGLQFARVRMFYNSDTTHDMGITVNFAGNSTLPSQGQQIISTGSSGESNRRIEVFQAWPELPSNLGFSIFTGNTLVK